MSSEDEGASLAGEWRHTYKRDVVTRLYPSQRAITEWDGKLTVVIGGPGGSKTTIKNLLADRLTDEGKFAPDECASISFNQSVAAETQEDLERELGVRGYDIGATTAHAKALEVLKKAGPEKRRGGVRVQVADDTDQKLAYQAVLHRLGEPDLSTWNILSTLKKVDKLKQSRVTPDELEEALGKEDAYERAGVLISQLKTASEALLRPAEATAAELTRIQGHLLSIADTLAESIPQEYESAAADSELAPLAHDAWTYLEYIRQTALRCVSWLEEHEAGICGSHPELAALPGYLLGDDKADSQLPDDLSSWSVSYRPQSEASLFFEEMTEAAAVLDTWRAYQDELDARGLIDFQDLLAEAIRLLETDPELRAEVQLKRLMVDESQDLTPPMVKFARLLADDEVILFGDTAQTINEWAGANRTTVQRLIDDGAIKEVLGVDFRKHPKIESLCDTFRATIDGEEALEMDSHREKVAGGSHTWPQRPILSVEQMDDGQAEYEAVIQAIEENRVPDWDVPEDVMVASLTRTTAAVGDSQQILCRLDIPYEVRGGGIADGTARVCALLRFVATIAGLGPQTPYVGQYDDTVEKAKYTLDLDESDAVSKLPSIMEWFFDVPASVATSALDRDECNEWVALVRIANYGNEEWLDKPAYRPAFEHAYQTLITIARRARLDRLPRLLDVIRDHCPLHRQFADPEVALDALEAAAGAVGERTRERPPRADLGAIQQLIARWDIDTGSNQDATHELSNIHKYKGSEADIVICRNLVSSAWRVRDLSPTQFDRDRAVENLARVRHRLAFDECPATESFSLRKLHNERRAAYVGASRARDLLVLIGCGDDSESAPASAVNPDGCLPTAIKRYDLTRSFDPWSELHDAIDDTGWREWTRTELGLPEEESM
ncbi:UvrD-helicase domain-containing protein [Salinigranum halophilum]|uniref:UvrD-helicase domain-containing protein n=1 Tax=Salinigranum halophilum TaxID=2565931 RepID=UPI0010A77C2B|nr:UvrD-helicase domain-containing protein [Salinigranum halophilum]